MPSDPLMSTRSFPNELAAQLEAIAQREKRSPEAVLNSMFAQYQSPQSPPAPDAEGFRQARLRAYARARRYWQQVGNAESLAVTDDQLDEQFWLIDADGVPHLKSEQGTIEITPDPLLLMAQAADQLG